MQRCCPCLLRALAAVARSGAAAGVPLGRDTAHLCAAQLAAARRAFTVAAAWPAAHDACSSPWAARWVPWQLHSAHGLASAPAAAEAPVDPAAESDAAQEPVRLTDNAVQRLRELLADVAKPEEKVLRLTVEAGGCSGFSYSFDLAAGARDDDLVFERDGVALVVDAVSYEFVRGAAVDFVDSLIKSTFEARAGGPAKAQAVVQNPNSASSCGCGSSFTPKF